MKGNDPELVFTEEITTHFIQCRVMDKTVIKIREKIISEHNRGFRNCEKVESLPVDVYRLKIGDYRMFFHMRNFVIYCLAYVHRSHCYKKNELDRVTTQVLKLTTKNKFE